MIKSLKFKNFKCWPEFNIPKLSKLTGLFGTNSSGKTSVLQFLLLLKQTVESTDRALVLNLGTDKDYIELGTYQDMVFEHNLNKTFEFSIGWKFEKPYELLETEEIKKVLLTDSELTFSTELSQSKTKKVFIDNFSYKFAEHVIRMKRTDTDRYKYRITSENATSGSENKIKIKRTPGRVWDLPEPVKFYGFPDQVRTYYQGLGFLYDLQLRFEQMFNEIFYLGPLRDYPRRQYPWTGSQPSDMGRRGEKFAEAILASRQNKDKISRGQGLKKMTLEEYVAFWLKELGLIDSFTVKEIGEGSNLYQVKVRKTAKSPEVFITDVGFGVSQILPVITLCYYVPEGSTLIIEQPEIHLHPKVQAGLADVFIDAIRNRNIQIILESHSEYLLRRLQRRIAEDKYSTDEVKLFFCSQKDNQSQLTELDVNLFGQIRNWPKDFFGDEIGELASTNEAIKNKLSKK